MYENDSESLAVVGDVSSSTYQLVHNQGARPRAFVASRWHWYASEDALLTALFPPGAPVADREVLETVHLLGTGSDHDDGGAPVPCATHSPRPELVRMTCDSSGGYAVLLDAWADGWTATVDGAPARIEHADALVRAVKVPSGKHIIEMRYRTPGLRAGAIVSALAWLALVAAWLLVRRATSESDPSSP